MHDQRGQRLAAHALDIRPARASGPVNDVELAKKQRQSLENGNAERARHKTETEAKTPPRLDAHTLQMRAARARRPAAQRQRQERHRPRALGVPLSVIDRRG
jgi:hypothetical protein